MKKILITGGAGFIGTEIINQLCAQGDWEITVLDAMTVQIHGENWQNSYLYQSIEGKCRFIRGSVTDLDAMKEALDGQEYVIHLAAETGTGQSMYQINQYNETNIMGTSNLLQVISLMGKQNTVKKIVLSSSRSVYGEGKYECPRCGIVYPKGRQKDRMLAGDFAFYCPTCGEKLRLLPTAEDSLIQPMSLYAYTKYAQERMLETMCPALGVDYTIFRYQNVYGVGQSLKNPYTGILSIFSTLMLDNKPINIFEDGQESRDFVNVRDVAACTISSLSKPESSGKIINVGSGVNTSVIEIAETLKKYYNSSSEIRITGDFRIGDIAHNKADISAAKKLLQFTPTVSLQEGLSSFCQWVMGQGEKTDNYQQSLTEMEKAGMFIRKQSNAG